jgi:hypothetical protein
MDTQVTITPKSTKSKAGLIIGIGATALVGFGIYWVFIAKTKAGITRFQKWTSASKIGNVPPASSGVAQVAVNLGVDPSLINNGILSVSFNKGSNSAQFYTNNRIFIYDDTKSPSVIMAKGTYSNGGQKIVIDNGKTIVSQNVWNNLISTLS